MGVVGTLVVVAGKDAVVVGALGVGGEERVVVDRALGVLA